MNEYFIQIVSTFVVVVLCSFQDRYITGDNLWSIEPYGVIFPYMWEIYPHHYELDFKSTCLRHLS